MRLLSSRTRLWAVFVALFFAVSAVGAEPLVREDKVAFAKKKRKKRKKSRRSKKRRADKAEKKDADDEAPPETAPVPDDPPAPDLDALKQELAAAKAEAEGRKQSKVTPGTVSRWSNRGAMVPVDSEIEVTAPLPERNVPVPVGVETPGQDLIGQEEILSARLALSVYHMQTRGQDFVFANERNEGQEPGVRIEGVDRDIQLLRGRAHLAYERIAGSDFGVHMDLEYRPVINGARFTDSQLNELYVSYGRTDFRRPGGPSWGLAAGRLAIREAGYAQADGLAFRWRIVPELQVGAFAGVTGNPYGYNWRFRNTELFSADWWTGGAFASVRWQRLTVDVAGVVTFANLLFDSIEDPDVQQGPGIDRVYAFVDAAYLLTDDLNVLFTGFFDMLPDSSTIQNVELIGSWTPLEDLRVRFGVGRFSTVIYSLTTDYSFSYDPTGNVFQQNGPPIVDSDGNPIVPFDGVLASTTYNQIKFRAGYRLLEDIDVWFRLDTLIRDLSTTNDLNQEVFGQTIEFATLRMLPQIGARYRNPKIVDAMASFTYVADDESNVNAIVRGGLGRGLFGLYVSADARYFAGEIDGADGGVGLSYTLPRDWFPGLMMLRGSFRYFRESLRLRRPAPGSPDQLDVDDPVFFIPLQESYMGFAGIEWRL